jgi:cytidine deaminase
MNIDFQELMNNAKEAAKNSYSPFSRFAVGAAVITPSGKIYKGCNVENSSFGLTNCAERTAIFKAVSEGEREIRAVAIYSPNADSCYPCGACRQVMVELAPQMEVLLINQEGKQIFTTVEKLMPYSFSDFPQQTENDEGDV